MVPGLASFSYSTSDRHPDDRLTVVGIPLLGLCCVIRLILMPSAASTIFPERAERCQIWNAKLADSVLEFSNQHQDATMLLFDDHTLFTRLHEDPVAFGFSEGSGHMYDQELYVDNIHPTTKVHQIVAREVASLLTGEEIELEQPDRYHFVEPEGDLFL